MIGTQFVTTNPHKHEWIKCKISGTFFLFELIDLLIIHENCWEVEEGHFQKMFPRRNIYTNEFFQVLVILIKPINTSNRRLHFVFI